jgi:NitT/TauT family transport system substrate-binding protein
MIGRRAFLRGSSVVAGTVLTGIAVRPASAEPPPETSKIRLLRSTSLCWAPQFVAEEFLRAEGFKDVVYREVPVGQPISQSLAAGDADISMNFVAPNLLRVEQGDPVVFLAGAHVGCFEVFGGEHLKKITDLKGKTVPVTVLNGVEYVYFAAIATYVGLDPRRDIHWLVRDTDEGMRLFVDGKVDAYIGFPPRPQELRRRKVGHVILNSATDRPWSQYFCCLVTASRAFVAKHPVATKRALRAILKSADLCGAEPERVARTLVERQFAPRVDDATQVMRELPYGKWREYDPEDTIRFYALRLHEAGLIKSSPQKLIAQASDWRFLSELKKELKG